jgi:hypothetical protein
MKLVLRTLFIYMPMLLLAVILCGVGVIWQQNLVSREDLRELQRMTRSHGFGATLAVIQIYATGTSELVTDPGYGRKPTEGRGHTPWVMRTNLDGKPRMLSFALAPGVWAAYDTSSASLYQVWQGEILFQGAVYDYLHGPQPESSGAWYVRREQPHPWVLRSEITGEHVQRPVRLVLRQVGYQTRPQQARRFACRSETAQVAVSHRNRSNRDTDRRVCRVHEEDALSCVDARHGELPSMGRVVG